jgi:threonine/homoserine/homoserine lactone efflux protein
MTPQDRQVVATFTGLLAGAAVVAYVGWRAWRRWRYLDDLTGGE